MVKLTDECQNIKKTIWNCKTFAQPAYLLQIPLYLPYSKRLFLYYFHVRFISKCSRQFQTWTNFPNNSRVHDALFQPLPISKIV